MVSRPKGGLGRGLGAIIPTNTTTPVAGSPADAAADDASPLGLQELPVTAISPNEYQPRDYFDEEDLVSLTDSISQLGVLQPVLVRVKSDGSYELIAGERRWRAAQRAGLNTIPAVVREVEDQAALEQALVENLHRADLNAIEEAAAYQQLMDDFGLTQEQVAVRVGKSRSAVANGLRLFQLPPGIQRMVIDGSLSAGHARALLSADPDEIDVLADRVVDEQLSVRALESLVRDEAPGSGDGDGVGTTESDTDDVSARGGAVGSVPPAALLELQELLSDFLETRVGITMGSKVGRIAVDFADIDDLERVFRLIVGDDE